METFYNPVTVHFQENGISDIERLLEANQLDIPPTHILLLSRGGNFQETTSYAILLDQLKQKQVLEISLEVANPDIADLYQVLQQVRSFPYELIIAVGGGSVMDVAKSVALLGRRDFTGVSELRSAITGDLGTINKQNKRTDICPWIALPTTSGTGSEVTPWATIWDRELNLKYSVEHPGLFALHAIIDPVLTVNLPIRPTMVTGLDALCHATEAYWSKRSNLISRLYALQAIKLIVEYLPLIIEEPRNSNVRSKLALGSVLAGMAFSNTKTTACHSISYPMTLLYGIEHGIAASITLGSIMKWNEAMIPEKELLLQAFGVTEVEEVQGVIAMIYSKAGIASRLSEYGINDQGIEDIVAKSFTKGRMDNNPVPITKEQLVQIMRNLR